MDRVNRGQLILKIIQGGEESRDVDLFSFSWRIVVLDRWNYYIDIG